MAIGNGLRADVWAEFVARFRVPRVAEFYASTEGNASLINVTNAVGAVGYLSDFLKPFAPHRFLRYDIGRDALVRGPGGWCVDAVAGEAGELVGKITADLSTRPEAYTNAEATQRKVLRDVFVKGDQYFRVRPVEKCRA